MDSTNFGIGADIETISRFVKLAQNSRLLNRVFTSSELEYCLSKKAPAPHLAARFAGKEAVIKALSSLGRAKPNYREIEILIGKSGEPIARVNRDAFSDLHIKVSLSHSRDKALAFAIAVRMTP